MALGAVRFCIETVFEFSGERFWSAFRIMLSFGRPVSRLSIFFEGMVSIWFFAAERIACRVEAVFFSEGGRRTMELLSGNFEMLGFPFVVSHVRPTLRPVGMLESSIASWSVGMLESRIASWPVGMLEPRIPSWRIGMLESRLASWRIGMLESRLASWLLEYLSRSAGLIAYLFSVGNSGSCG